MIRRGNLVDSGRCTFDFHPKTSRAGWAELGGTILTMWIAGPPSSLRGPLGQSSKEAFGGRAVMGSAMDATKDVASI
jgi:hypothetical protein